MPDANNDGAKVVKQEIRSAFLALKPRSMDVSAEEIKGNREFVGLTARQLFISISDARERLAALVDEVRQEITAERGRGW